MPKISFAQRTYGVDALAAALNSALESLGDVRIEVRVARIHQMVMLQLAAPQGTRSTQP
jgi:hypothetical protein